MARQWQWHPRVHEEWASERLCFWRIAFSPTYDRAKVMALLETAMDAQGISSFAVYELFGGGFDILLKAWLSGPHKAFEETVRHTLREYTVVLQPFTVTEVVLESPWVNGERALATPTQSRLQQRLDDDEIAAVTHDAVSDRQAKRYEEEGLIANVGPAHSAEDIRFVTVISANQHPMTHHAVDRLQSHLVDVLLDAPGVSDISLYAGIGFGQYILVGAVKDYFDINRSIAEPINAAVDPAMFGARTTTLLVSLPYLLGFQEQIGGTEEEPGSLGAEAYLEQEESHTLEVKGSAVVDVQRWALGDGLLEESDKITDAFIRAAVGMLNADGGTVLVGALEAQRFERKDKLAESPLIGNYLCVGIELDTGEGGWDGYERKLRQLLAARVKPDPNPWLTFTPEEVESRQLCRATIRVPDRGVAAKPSWFYHYPQDQDRIAHFWARQGNRTVQLDGLELDEYRFEKSHAGS